MGKIRPDWVIVQGKEEHHPEGNFYLHRYEGNKEIWKKIGPNAQDAVNAADFESTYLTARAKGIDGLLFQIFLLTGFREDEIKYLTWDDIDGTTATLRVTPKPQYDFEIKDHEERAVVIPYQLLGHLLLYRMIVEGAAKNEGRDVYPLIFPTKTGRPNGHMLEKCKRIAKRAGLDPNRFWLHKFRSHYATMLLRSGLDIITVRKMLGHKPGSEATFRYLAPMHHKEVRDKGVDRIFEHILYLCHSDSLSKEPISECERVEIEGLADSDHHRQNRQNILCVAMVPAMVRCR